MSTILIVEDNEKNMKLARDILRPRATRRSRPSPARRACGWRSSATPDLVLMDIQLPDINGIEALRQIRGDAALDGDPGDRASPPRSCPTTADDHRAPASTPSSPSRST